MSTLKKTLILIVLLTLGLMSFYSSNIKTTLYTATGFSAKNLCSGYFISGFSVETIFREALVPVSSMFSYVNYDVDDKGKSVKTNVLGFFNRTAIYKNGLGCTLLAISQDKLNRSVFTLASLENKNKLQQVVNTLAVQKNTDDYKNELSSILSKAFEESSSNQSKISNGFRNTKAVVVLHKGNIIAEKYSSGVTQDTPLLSWSMAKSVTSLLVGVLVKDNGLDIYANKLLSQWRSKEEHKKITIDHLLRMSSGLEFNEKYGVGSDAAKMLSVEVSASDFAINKELEFPLDSHWSYSSGTTNIISAIIKEKVGGSFQFYYEFAQQRLFRPIGIESAILEMDASGTFIGSSYMYMTARDWAKLGQLCLQNGQWGGRQILPKDWINYAKTPTKTSPLNNYGAHFWLNKDPDDKILKRHWPSLPEDLYYMSGFQGQTVAIIPSQELIVVRLGFSGSGVERGTEELIRDVIELL